MFIASAPGWNFVSLYLTPCNIFVIIAILTVTKHLLVLIFSYQISKKFGDNFVLHLVFGGDN